MADATVGTVEAYDIASRRWTARSPMPTPRVFAAAAVLDGKVHVFGGLDAAGRALDSAEVYDPATDRWNTLPPMGMARSRLAAAVLGGRGILIAGGMDGAVVNSERVRHLLPGGGPVGALGSLRDGVPLPSPRHGHALFGEGNGSGRVLSVGGYGDAGVLAAVDILDAGEGEGGTARRWRPGPPLAVARGFFGLAAAGRRLYAVGGRCDPIPSTEVLDLDAPEAGWKRAAPLPKDLCRFSMVGTEDGLLVFGGETDYGAGVNTEVLAYDPARDAWTVR